MEYLPQKRIILTVHWNNETERFSTPPKHWKDYRWLRVEWLVDACSELFRVPR